MNVVVPCSDLILADSPKVSTCEEEQGTVLRGLSAHSISTRSYSSFDRLYDMRNCDQTLHDERWGCCSKASAK